MKSKASNGHNRIIALGGVNGIIQPGARGALDRVLEYSPAPRAFCISDLTDNGSTPMLKIIHLPNKSTRFEDVYYVSTDLMSPVFAIVTVNKFEDVTHCSCLKADCQHIQAVENELMADDEIIETCPIPNCGLPTETILAESGAGCGERAFCDVHGDVTRELAEVTI